MVTPSSPTIFNINMDEIIVKWNWIYTRGITLSAVTEIIILLFADDQARIADSEDIYSGSVDATKHSEKI
jgi:hypothetical protein